MLVYIFAPSFISTLIVLMVSRSAALAFRNRPFDGADLIAGLLISFAEAFLTGALTSGFVVFSPRLLATYSDRLCLPSGVQLLREHVGRPFAHSGTPLDADAAVWTSS